MCYYTLSCCNHNVTVYYTTRQTQVPDIVRYFVIKRQRGLPSVALGTLIMRSGSRTDCSCSKYLCLNFLTVPSATEWLSSIEYFLTAALYLWQVPQRAHLVQSETSRGRRVSQLLPFAQAYLAILACVSYNSLLL